MTRYFQIEVKHIPTGKTYLYYEADGNEYEKACETIEENGICINRLVVREWDPVGRKRVRKGREFGVRLRVVHAVLSTGRIITEQWYEPLRWD